MCTHWRQQSSKQETSDKVKGMTLCILAKILSLDPKFQSFLEEYVPTILFDTPGETIFLNL